MYKILTALCFLFLALPARSAQAEDIDTQYTKMVATSKDMPADFDFAMARDLYTKTSFYAPYKTMVAKDFQDFVSRRKVGEEKAMADMEKYITNNFAMPEVHSQANTVYRDLNQQEQTVYHTWALSGLMKALMTSGDGKSAATAFHVVNVSEEALLTRGTGKVGAQRLDDKSVPGRVFDVLSISHYDGTKDDVWFDVTDIYGKAKPN